MLWTRGDAISTETGAPAEPEVHAAGRGVYHRWAPGADPAHPVLRHAAQHLKAKTFHQTES